MSCEIPYVSSTGKKRAWDELNHQNPKPKKSKKDGETLPESTPAPVDLYKSYAMTLENDSENTAFFQIADNHEDWVGFLADVSYSLNSNAEYVSLKYVKNVSEGIVAKFAQYLVVREDKIDQLFNTFKDRPFVLFPILSTFNQPDILTTVLKNKSILDKPGVNMALQPILEKQRCADIDIVTTVNNEEKILLRVNKQLLKIASGTFRDIEEEICNENKFPIELNFSHKTISLALKFCFAQEVDIISIPEDLDDLQDLLKCIQYFGCERAQEFVFPRVIEELQNVRFKIDDKGDFIQQPEYLVDFEYYKIVLSELSRNQYCQEEISKFLQKVMKFSYIEELNLSEKSKEDIHDVLFYMKEYMITGVDFDQPMWYLNALTVHCPNLEKLQSNITSILSLQAIRTLKNLRTLILPNFTGFKAVKDLSRIQWLDDLTKLQELDFYYDGELMSLWISGICRHQKLRKITVRNPLNTLWLPLQQLISHTLQELCIDGHYAFDWTFLLDVMIARKMDKVELRNYFPEQRKALEHVRSRFPEEILKKVIFID